MIKIDYIAHKGRLRVKNEKGTRFIFDPIRKKWLVLLPEELVRQLVVQYLTVDRGYPASRIAIEKGVIINERQKRLDILIYDKEGKPFLLVECKAATIKLDDKVFEQIAMYNLSFSVPYLMVTNGLQTYCCEMDYKNQCFNFLEEIPDFNPETKNNKD